jgi:hypothetical protein
MEPLLVGEAVAGEAASVRNELEALIKNSNSSAFDIGELAYKVKSNALYTGFTTFQEYGKSLPIKLRKLQYLARIAEVMSIMETPRATYEPLGIAKLREITSLDVEGSWTNPETSEKVDIKTFITSFIAKGQSMSLETIKQHVRTLKGLVGENNIVVVHFGIKQSVLDNVVRPALDLAKAQLGSASKDDEGVSHDASDGRALEVVAISFLNDPANGILAEGA